MIQCARIQLTILACSFRYVCGHALNGVTYSSAAFTYAGLDFAVKVLTAVLGRLAALRVGPMKLWRACVGWRVTR